MRLGSLFAGIGGLELGLEAALGARTVWQVEFAEFPRQVLARHWPDADRSVTDVCEAGAHNLAPVDLICGGFPCQDISSAGKGAGITGAKSGLWREYARIVRDVGPSVVVVENSPMLTSRGLGVVLGDLAELGFDAEWARIGACDVGAPHRRWRLFIVAWRGLGGLDADLCSEPDGPEHAEARQYQGVAGQGPPDPDSKPLRVQPGRLGGQGGTEAPEPGHDGEDRGAGTVANSNLWGQQGSRGAQRNEHPSQGRIGWGASHWLSEPAVGRVAHGVSAGLDRPGPRLGPHGRKRLHALGNAVVPQVAYEVGLWVRSILTREVA